MSRSEREENGVPSSLSSSLVTSYMYINSKRLKPKSARRYNSKRSRGREQRRSGAATRRMLSNISVSEPYL